MGKPLAGASLDQREVSKFDALAEAWWDPNGPMRPLHKLNPVRLAYIRDRACEAFGGDPRGLRPLQGLRALDLGCGCGLVAEPLSRMGASVTAIDPSQRNIEVARLHAKGAGLEIDYRACDSEALLADGPVTGVASFDLLTCLEVIEHSADPERLIGDIAELLAPGGLLVLSTLSRTPKAFLQAIVGAELLLGWLPRGTHQWRRFLKPSEVARMLRRSQLRVVDVTGLAYDPSRDAFGLCRERDVNYLLTARRT